MLQNVLILMKQEWAIMSIMLLLLIIKVSTNDWKNERLLQLINALLLLNVMIGFWEQPSGKLFSEMYQTNALMVLEKNILNIALYLVSLLGYSWLKTHQHVIEFYLLLLATLLGMFFMISSRNLLMLYVGLEMSTIPLAALVNFELNKKQASEAAMKMIFSSALSSGIVLMGISFIYGATGSLDFASIGILHAGNGLHVLAFLFLITGFAFKISAVPFHLWTADVYEGAPVAITAYLSVVSKGAVLFTFTSILYTVFKTLSVTWYHYVMILSVATMLIGNLFALRQKNIKRFLAFSSIAQIGFVLLGISGGTQMSAASVVYFVAVYAFSNLAAFGVVSVVSSAIGSEQIADFKGFYQNNKWLSWVMALALFSLAGIPPTAGFFGKFFLIFGGATKGNYVFLTIAALNVVISLYYYLNVVKLIFMETQPQPIEKLEVPLMQQLGLYIGVAGILLLGLMSWIYDAIFNVSFTL